MTNQQHDYGPIAIYRSKYLIITVFGLLVGLGFFLAAIHAWFYLGLKSSQYQIHQILILGFRLSISIPIGAYLMSRALDMGRLFRGEITLPAFFRIPGFALWGGLFSGIITILATAHQFNWESLFIFDAAVFGLPLAQMFGRIGCLNYGCCHGRPHGGRWSIKYQNTESKVIRTYAHLRGIDLYPTQVYSGLANLGIYLIIISLVILFPAAEKGLLTSVYLILYGLKRYIIEFFRGEFPRTSFLGLSLWQWFSLGFIASGIILGLSLMNPFFGSPTRYFYLSDGFSMVLVLTPMTLLATSIITFIYSLHGKRIGNW
ncbi:MAG: prolipoprotein diacylglyceryl transferase [Fidelibacterota bacterium]